jgi:hypothetical protein
LTSLVEPLDGEQFVLHPGVMTCICPKLGGDEPAYSAWRPWLPGPTAGSHEPRNGPRKSVRVCAGCRESRQRRGCAGVMHTGQHRQMWDSVVLSCCDVHGGKASKTGYFGNYVC